MNETVIVQSDYKNLSIQDFDVTYLKNSDDEFDQIMEFKIVNIT